MSRVALTCTVMLVAGVFSAARSATSLGDHFIPGQAVDGDYESFARGFLQNHCIDCHGETDPEAGLSLHDIGPVDEINAAVSGAASGRR
jgi:hypothetical protein